MSGVIHLVRNYLMTDFSTPSSSYAYEHIYSNQFCVHDFIDSILSFPILTLLVCIVSYFFTSEIQELMFLFQTLTTFWHLIQFPVVYLGRRFR